MILYRCTKAAEDKFALEALKNNIVIDSSEAIFDNEKTAAAFAELCNELKLSPLHLADIAEDILKERSNIEKRKSGIESTKE